MGAQESEMIIVNQLPSFFLFRNEMDANCLPRVDTLECILNGVIVIFIVMCVVVW